MHQEALRMRSGFATRSSRKLRKEEVAKNKDECDVKTEGGAKPLTCLGECAVPDRGTEECVGNVALPSNTVSTMFIIGCTWAIYGQLG